MGLVNVYVSNADVEVEKKSSRVSKSFLTRCTNSIEEFVFLRKNFQQYVSIHSF